jgi:hypothetical protein
MRLPLMISLLPTWPRDPFTNPPAPPPVTAACALRPAVASASSAQPQLGAAAHRSRTCDLGQTGNTGVRWRHTSVSNCTEITHSPMIRCTVRGDSEHCGNWHVRCDEDLNRISEEPHARPRSIRDRSTTLPGGGHGWPAHPP